MPDKIKVSDDKPLNRAIPRIKKDVRMANKNALAAIARSKDLPSNTMPSTAPKPLLKRCQA